MDKTKKDLLVFGYGLGLIAAFFGLRGLIEHGPGWAALALLACSVIFILVSALRWEALRPGYHGWMKVAHLIGSVVTVLILTVVFFFVFAPIGILLGILRKDHLERRIDPAAKTYWNQRPKAAFEKNRYTQQF